MALPPWERHFAGLPEDVINLLRPHAAAYDKAFMMFCKSREIRDFLKPEFRGDELRLHSEFWVQNPLSVKFLGAAWYTPRLTAADPASACV